jgi:hypothetical protein
MKPHYFGTEHIVFMCTQESLFHEGDCIAGGQTSEAPLDPELGIPTND